MNKLTYLALIGASNVNAVAMKGVNAGGWMVLEPWITPSLFYRFTDKTKDDGVGMDSYTFCEALGPEEGNKVMRAHWDAWYTEQNIKDLKDREIEVIRLPVGDWTLNQYGPYVGCMDGADDKITWFLDTCKENDIKVLMDVHAMKDSQNGYDNSGKASDVIWSS
jgi:glucan 1,3-beta-glucosidase